MISLPLGVKIIICFWIRCTWLEDHFVELSHAEILWLDGSGLLSLWACSRLCFQGDSRSGLFSLWACSRLWFRVIAQLSKSSCFSCQGLTPVSLMTWSWLSNLGCVSTEENVNSLPAYPGRGATLPAPKELWKCDHNIALWFPLKTPPIYSAFGMISSEPLSGRILNPPVSKKF